MGRWRKAHRVAYGGGGGGSDGGEARGSWGGVAWASVVVMSGWGCDVFSTCSWD